MPTEEPLALRYGESSEPWDHGESFNPPIPCERRHEGIERAIEYVALSGIGAGEFFSIAARSRLALKLWVSQEIITTGPFSQLVLKTASRIRNVHVRAMVTQVVYGEHHRVRAGVASASHPWLLDMLRRSVYISPSEIRALPETSRFLNELAEQCAGSTIRAVGALGVGNELLLLPEYSAIRRAFESAWPECDYAPFLDANIAEDKLHSELMADVGQALIDTGEDPQEFLEGAVAAVKSRLLYYDALAKRL